MPEGHTIHRIARDHTRDFVGQRLSVSSPQGRFSAGAKTLSGRRLNSVEAHGKHLCYCWSGNKLLHIHLGLYGKFRRHRLPVPEPRGQVRLRAVGEQWAFDLNGPNTCELISKSEWARLRRRLGPDPLRGDGEPDLAWRRIQNSRSPIGTLLLNQSVVAGVGNVYRSEVLHLLNIHPEVAGKSLSRKQFDEIWSTLSALLRIGVRHNRIIIADPKEVGKPRSRMTKAERLLIYKRSTCLQCDGPVQSWLLGARKVYACNRCQALG